MTANVVYYCSNCKGYFYPFQRDGVYCYDCGSNLLTDLWYCSECPMPEDELGRPIPHQAAYGYRMCPDHLHS